MKYKNPVISGHNPDPSICRVENEYYMVSSSFEYFPGVPVYRSRNLVDWNLEGYCLTRNSQAGLEKTKSSGGIYAPALYHHNGIFYMTTTNIDRGNFIVYTDDMKKGWSEPVWIDQDGIDPSLLFDCDGTVYFLSVVMSQRESQIILCKINPMNGTRLSASVAINKGCGGKYAEAPHLYRIKGNYYLMLAEGGTEYGHMVTIQRAPSPYGPYETCPHNPILSHRDDMLGEICCTGHADLTEDQNGNWWMICLGIRPNSTPESKVLLHHLGRETFLAPVMWNSEEWPVVGNNGRISLSMEGPLPDSHKEPVSRDFYDIFRSEKASLHYNYLRKPVMSHYVRNTEKQELILKGTALTLNDALNPTWIGIRQKGFYITSMVKVRLLETQPGVRAGISAFYNESYHYEIYLTKEQGHMRVCLAKHVHDIFVVTAAADIPGEDQEIMLKITADKVAYYFWYSIDGINFIKLGQGLTAGLATEGTSKMTFTGTYIALFAEKGTAVFRTFSVHVSDH